eukprot:GEMP01112572.1.p1 GENE.GEMP01112572.1~~GEMP01112572.1.p1  ORF type:complete len:116 (+),score=15.09 GEMP01112572.1:45-392(+)
MFQSRPRYSRRPLSAWAWRQSALPWGIRICVESQRREVWVAADGVSSQRAIDREMALVYMKQCGAVISTSESIIFDLIKRKEHPAFKTVSQIAKDYGQALRSLNSFGDGLANGKL